MGVMEPIKRASVWESLAQYGSLLPLAWAITLIHIIDILDPKMRPVEPSDTDTAHHPGCDLP
jgi:hypothetical protein